jgi:hypothetical protein
MGEPGFVSLSIPVIIIHSQRGPADRQNHVVIAKQGAPGRYRVAAGRETGRRKCAVPDRSIFRKLRPGWSKVFNSHDPWRQEVMVQDGLEAGESFQTHDLLPVQTAVGLSKLGMALVRDLAKPMIERHGGLLSIN